MGGFVARAAERLMESHVQADHAVKKFRVSDAGKCLRMRFCKRACVPGSPVPGSNGRQMMGTLMHEWLEQALVSENPDCDVTLESTVEDDHRIGHIDVLITRGAELTVLDIKTATHNSVKKILENPPKPYLYQAATYADMRGADGAELLILDKDTLERIVVPVPQEAFDGAREEWEALIACWERGETPPSTDEERECLYCPWKERCGKGELPGTITQQKEG